MSLMAGVTLGPGLPKVLSDFEEPANPGRSGIVDNKVPTEAIVRTMRIRVRRGVQVRFHFDERMAVSGFDRQLEATVNGMLSSGETVLERGTGLDGLKPSAMILTNRRLIFLRMGTTRFSNLRVADVRLEDVLTVEAASGHLRVDARSGIFGIAGKGRFRNEIGQWPNLILKAQDALKRAPASAPSDPVRDLGEQLAQLSALRSSGALNEQEFTAAKGRLLGN
jgi:hypothetical protein